MADGYCVKVTQASGRESFVVQKNDAVWGKDRSRYDWSLAVYKACEVFESERFEPASPTSVVRVEILPATPPVTG